MTDHDWLLTQSSVDPSPNPLSGLSDADPFQHPLTDRRRNHQNSRLTTLNLRLEFDGFENLVVKMDPRAIHVSKRIPSTFFQPGSLLGELR